MRAKVILLLLVTFLSLAGSLCAQTIIAWNPGSLSGGGPSPWAPTTVNSNLTVGGLTRGSGLTLSGSMAGGAWGCNGWSSTAAAAISSNDFATFTVTANSGYTVSLSSLQMAYRRSSTGPGSGELQYSIDGGAYTTITTLSYSSTSSGGGSIPTVNLSGVSALQSVPSGSTVTIRFVNYGASSASGTWYVHDSPSPNGLIISGTVVSGCTPPTATISGSTSVCSGNTANIVFNGTANAEVTYNIDGGSDQTVTLDASGNATVTTASLTTTTTYNLVSADLSGCAQNLTGNAVITVNPAPTVTISGTTGVCSGGNADITFSGTPNATVVYNINGGTNTIIVLDGSGNATVNTGAITADAVYSLVGLTDGTCTTTATGTATVSITNLTGAISGTTSICSGSNTDITFTGSPNATISYTVDGGASQTVVLDGSGTATVNTGALVADATYALVDITLGACNTAITGSAVITIGSPVATIAGTTTICDGDNTDITFNGTPNGTVTYNINGGSNLTVVLNGTGTATVNTGALAANATYNLVSIDAGTCSASVSGAATVTVNPLPTAAISGTATICSGGNADITFTGTPNAVVTYTVNGGANTTVTLNGAGTATVNTGTISADATYAMVSASLNSCVQPLTGSAVVTVNPLPTAAIAGTATICSGGNADVTFTGTPNAVVTYTLNGGANTTVTLSGAGTATVNTGAITANAVYALVNVSLNSCSQAQSGSATITVDPLPTTVIAGTTTICSGANADITFTGTPNAVITYTINGGANTTVTLSGAGTATVNTGNITANATYALVSASLNSCVQPLTGSVVVTVNPLPIASVAGTATICSGTSATITFVGTPNAIVTYNINGGTNTTVTLSGAGLATVSTGAITANAVYTVVSASLNSCSQPQSSTATVTVNPLPTASISGAATICSGGNADITFTGTPNAVVTYTVNGGANTTVTLSGAGTATVNTGSISANATYALVSAGLNSCVEPLTGSAVVTVNPLPTVAISGAATICSGSASDINFVGTPNAVVTYNINGGANTTVALNGAGLATVSTGPISANAVYTLVSVSLNTCSQTLTNSVTVTVNPMPTVAISGTATICSGDNADITFTGTANAGVTYTVNGGANTTVALSGAGTATVNTGAITANAVYALVSVSLNSCSQAQSGTATVTVNPLPTATISGATTICSGSNADVTFNGTPNATVTYTINGGANTTVALDGAGTGMVNTGAITTDAVFALVSVSLNSCSQAQSGSVTVTVDPLPTATISGTAAICSGDNTDITFSGTPNATVTYNIDGGTNTTIILDGAGNAMINTGAITANTTYSIVEAMLNSCTQTLSGSAVVTINALPVATISGNATICSGDNANITFTGTPNATVSYTLNTVSQSVLLDGSGDATVNTGAITSTAMYELVSVDLGLCSQNITGDATVTVNPLPTVAISGTTAVCSGTGTDITFNGTPNAVVTYTVDGGANQTITLDGAGAALVNTGNMTTAVSYDLVSVDDGQCATNVTGNATVSVNIIPTAAISGTASICSGNSTNIAFTGTPNADVFYTINSGSQQSIALDGTGNAVLSTGVLTGNATYSIVSVSLNSCAASLTGAAIVTVSPTPTVAISGSATLAPGNTADITFTGTPNATVTYTLNGGASQSVVLDAAGNAVVNTGVLFVDMTYALVDVTLGCTAPATGSAVITMTIGYGPIYTYTNAGAGVFDFVATDATGYDLSLFNGATVSSTSCSSGYTTDNYSAATSYDPATNKAVTMKVTPNGIHRLVITGFSVGVRRSADGPQYVRLAYSLDGGASWIDSGVDEMPNNGACDNVATLNWTIAPFQVHSPTDGIMFGVFGFGAAATSGQLQILNLNVNGAVIEAPLPVTVKHFDGDCNRGDMGFSWSVAYESNISQYNIEYSADGKQFKTVAEIAVEQLSKGDKEYNYMLYDGAEGLYRLVSVENGGVKLYSKVTTVKCTDKEASTPTVVNTAGGSLNIRTGSDFEIGRQFDVQVINMNGQVIDNYKEVSVNGMQRHNISLPAGLYLVRLVQGALVSTHKIVVE